MTSDQADLHKWETVYDNGKVGISSYAVTRFRVPNGWIYEFPTHARCVFVPDLLNNFAVETVAEKAAEITSGMIEAVVLLERTEHWLSLPPMTQSDRDCVTSLCREIREFLRAHSEDKE